MRDNLAKGSGDEGIAPEFNLALAPDPVHRRNIDAIGDGMGTLDQLPGSALVLRHRPRLVGNPTDGGRIK